MGLVPAACDRVGETTGGAAHDDRRDQRVSQRRVGLAPTVRLMCRDDRAGQAARAAVGRRFTPCVAISASQAWPVVMTACRWRRIAAAMSACAWVGLNLLASRVVRC